MPPLLPHNARATAPTQCTCNKHSLCTREQVHMCMCQQGASACTHLCFGGSQLLCQLRGMTLGGTSQLEQHHLLLRHVTGQRVIVALSTPQPHTTPQAVNQYSRLTRDQSQAEPGRHTHTPPPRERHRQQSTDTLSIAVNAVNRRMPARARADINDNVQTHLHGTPEVDHQSVGQGAVSGTQCHTQRGSQHTSNETQAHRQ